jgi:hypothetical protein
MNYGINVVTEKDTKKLFVEKRVPRKQAVEEVKTLQKLHHEDVIKLVRFEAPKGPDDTELAAIYLEYCRGSIRKS